MTKQIVSFAILFLPFFSSGQYQLLENLEGAWVNDKDSSRMEIWEKGEEDGFEGRAVQLMKDGKERIWESLRIFNNEGVLCYEANVKGNPAPVAFGMSFVSATEVIFSNTKHDFPQHIHYQFVDKDHLHVEVYADKGDKKLIFDFSRKPSS